MIAPEIASLLHLLRGTPDGARRAGAQDAWEAASASQERPEASPGQAHDS